jgi:hypothetical protein
VETAPPGHDRANRRLTSCFLLWFPGTPVLLLVAFLVGLEEWANDGDGTLTSIALLVVVLVALLTPVAGMLLAVRARRTGFALVFAAALAISVGAGATTGVLSEDAARQLVRSVRPAEPPPPAGTGGCQERSGGDTDCPGG